MAAAAAAAQKEAAKANILNVSSLLRDAVAAAIPVAPEQYLTIAVPGTVIDTRTLDEGGTLVYDATRPFVPTSVHQEESRLVDNMVPLATVMVGNTGKSVARSYSRALDSLLPHKAEVRDSSGQIRSPGSPLYNDAMTKLKTKDPATGMTPVDVYIEKQTAWSEAQSEWDEAKVAARDAALENPDNLKNDGTVDRVKVQQEYNDWSQANYRKYKYAVQGRWMDWITNGNKYEVENDFGIVDVDSIMARVEDSKESMRNSTIVDSDGVNEVQLVHLTPPNWATECRLRAQGWRAQFGDYSIDQIDAEIVRLQRLDLSYDILEKSTVGATEKATYPVDGPTAPTAKDRGDEALSTALEDVYKARAKLNKDTANRRDDPSKRNDKPDPALVTDLDNKLAALRKVTNENRIFHADQAKYQVASLEGDNKQALADWIVAQRKDIQNSIDSLRTKRNFKSKGAVTLPVIEVPSGDEDGSDEGNTGVEIATPDATKAAALFEHGEIGTSNLALSPPGSAQPTLPTSPTKADPWTTISASFKAVDQTQTTNTSSWGTSIGGGGGYGLWSVGGSYAHEQSNSDSVSDMASCDVSVSFSAMVVNINRPWLHGELFNDFELDVADDILISPGAQSLKIMMQDQASTDPSKSANAIAYLAQYASFPAYPTSFVIAADTTLEFTGNTSHVESHFSQQSNSGSLSIGWGPFSVSSSFHQASSRSNFQMQTTATGCRISFGSPQIIGWVSQILPEMPRKSGYLPMIQNKKPNIIAITPPTLT